jgi:Trk K+ transport system NAD-binding subunit
MKTIAAELAYFLRGRAKENAKALLLYCLFLFILIMAYAVLFRFLMWHLEGREFSLIAGIYWTITVMTTLGFGDITFHSDPGYIFAAVVTVSGVIFLLIILPFGMISLFLAPWVEHRLRHRLSYVLPAATTGHVLIFGIDPVARSLTHRLQSLGIPFVVVISDHDTALRLAEEETYPVAHGTPTDTRTLDGLRISAARYVVANLSDPENANLCLTIRTRSQQVPIAAIVDDAEHIELLRLAGANQIIPLYRTVGHYLATRATTCGALAHVIDSFGSLVIAEVPVHGTPFAGQTLAAARIRQQTGLAVIGVWERGKFQVATPDTVLDPRALVVFAGRKEQLAALEALTGEDAGEDLVFILGHGRIGCAAAHFLARKPVPFILVDQKENPACEDHAVVYGDATSRFLLKSARIENAKGVIVTTNDDNANIFLTLSTRRLDPHVRIVARANRDENVDQLYTAGADFVVSNASVGASILMNILEGKESAFLTEGVSVFRRAVPAALHARTIADSRLREKTGCTIVALEPGGGGEPLVVPPPESLLLREMNLILIGSTEQAERFDEVSRRGAL